MNRREFTRVVAASVMALPALSPDLFAAEGKSLKAQAKKKPNILVILTDDIGWGDLRCYNPQGEIATPNVDRLAREGMMFTHAHTPAALCAPTRYSMLTGNYPWRGRSPGGTWGFNVPSQMLPGQQTVATMLRTAGYRTSMYGKAGTGGFWADSPDTKNSNSLAPIEWGFDYSYLIPRGHQATPYAFYENGVRDNVEWDTSKVGERLLTHAIGFLDDVKKSGKPFYMHFCTDGAHSPYVPAPTLAGEPLKGVSKMTEHTDMVHETDILTGKLMEALEKRGLLDNTLIVYTSDNGGLPFERQFGHDAVAGLRGRKGFLPEGGHRVPFLVRWPGKVPAGAVRDQVVSTFDIVPTALELAGVQIPAGQCLDAVSLVPVLTGASDDSHPVRSSLLVQSSPGRDFDDDGGIKGGPLTGKEQERASRSLHGREEGEDGRIEKSAKQKTKKQGSPSDGMGHAVYAGDWKLMINIADQPAALYDLKNDLTEGNNLINSQPERVKTMDAIYREIRASKASAAITRSNP